MKFTVSLEIPISAMCEVEIEAKTSEDAKRKALIMALNDELDFSTTSEVDLSDAGVVLISRA